VGGSDFGEGGEDEIALKHAGMGDLQGGRVDGFVSVEKNVEIDEARSFGEGLLAAHFGFDATEGGEELRRSQIGLRFEDRVEKPGLVEVVDRLGFVDAREFRDVNRGLRHAADGFAEIGLAIADVGAEREVNGGHVWLLYARPPAEKTKQGVGLGEFEGEGNGEEDDAVETEDENSAKDMAEGT
jgi:hypothetical protein